MQITNKTTGSFSSKSLLIAHTIEDKKKELSIDKHIDKRIDVFRYKKKSRGTMRNYTTMGMRVLMGIMLVVQGVSTVFIQSPKAFADEEEITSNKDEVSRTESTINPSITDPSSVSVDEGGVIEGDIGPKELVEGSSLPDNEVTTNNNAIPEGGEYNNTTPDLVVTAVDNKSIDLFDTGSATGSVFLSKEISGESIVDSIGNNRTGNDGTSGFNESIPGVKENQVDNEIDNNKLETLGEEISETGGNQQNEINNGLPIESIQKEPTKQTDYETIANSLQRETPTEKLILNADKTLDKETILSYNIQSESMTYCSYITRMNLERITGLKSVWGLAKNDQSISQGDAIDLIIQGVQNNSFQSFSYGQEKELIEQLDKGGYTVWDMYAHHTKIGLSIIEQGHRFVVFKSYNQRYVLDPVITHKKSAMLLSEYLLLLEPYKSTLYLPTTGYYPLGVHEKNKIAGFIKELPSGEFISREYNDELVWFYKVVEGGESSIVINKFANKERKGYEGLILADGQGVPIEHPIQLQAGDILLLSYSTHALEKAGYEIRESTLSLYHDIHTLDELKAAMSKDTDTINQKSIGKDFKVFIDQGKITIKFFDEMIDGYKEGDHIDINKAEKEIVQSLIQKKELIDHIDTYADKFIDNNNNNEGTGNKGISFSGDISTLIDTVGSEIVERALEKNTKDTISVKIEGSAGSLSVDQDDLEFQAGSLEAVINNLSNLDPGDYTVNVTLINPLTNETQVFSQTLSWGVIAINTDKDVYSVGDEVQVDIGVLDHQGYPTCDALIQGSVVGPDGSIQPLTIQKNNDCGRMESGYIVADFSTHFSSNQEGDYFISIDATTDKGVQHIDQRVQVLNQVPYIVTRSSATRNFPYGKTPMNISIHFNEAFQGTITDYTPTSFAISTLTPGGSVTMIGQRQAIQWDIHAQAGETVVVSYQYDAPNISPEFYSVGPLNFFNTETLNQYYEKRIRQIANDEYTQNNNNGEFVLTTLSNFIGIDLSNSLNVIGDTTLGVIRLSSSSTTGYFQTIDINPSSMYGRKDLIWSGSGNPTSIEIRDCSNVILSTIAVPTSPVSLASEPALSGVNCIRVRMYMSGSSSSPQFSQVKVTWNPKPIMTLNISGPSTINAGNCSDYTISWQNSFVDDTGVVLYIQLPSRVNGSVYNYTTGYGQYSGNNFYDPYFPGGYYGTGAPYINPLGLPITLNGKYTSVAISINGTNIPANSVYRAIGFVSAGTTSNYKFLLCSRIGTQTGTVYQLSGYIDGVLSEPNIDDYTTKILSIPGRSTSSSLSNTYSCDGAIKLAPNNTNKVVTYTHYVHNYIGGVQSENIFNPTVNFDFTDIINKLQSSCGVPDYSGAISRITFTTTGGIWSGSNHAFSPNIFSTGWLLPGAIKYFFFDIDYSGCNTSGSTFTYTGTFDGDNIIPLSFPRTLTIGECNVNTGQFIKYPTAVSNPYSYGQTIPYTLQFNNSIGDRKGMIILYDKIPTDIYIQSGATIQGATGYIYYSILGTGNAWNNPPSYNTGTILSGDAGPNWTTTFTTGAVWIMAAIPHMNSTLFPIPLTSSQYNIPYYSNLNFNGVIKSTGACSLNIRNTGAFEIRQRTNSPDSYDTGLITLSIPLTGSYANNLPAIPDEIRPVIQNPAPNNRFNPLTFLTYTVSNFIGIGTYTQTGQFVMGGADGSFNGNLTIPLPLLNVNGTLMYPSLSSVSLLRNGVPYSPYSTTATTSGSIAGNNSIILGFTGLQTGNYSYGVRLNIPHGFFLGGSTVIQLNGSNSCANYSGKSQLTINPIQGNQIIQAFKYRETPISAPNGIIQYTLNTQSLGNRYTTNTFIIDKIPTNTNFVSAQTSGSTANLQVFNCEGCKVYLYSGATLPPNPTSGFIFSNFATGVNNSGVRTSPFPANQVTYIAYKIDNPNTIPPNVFPVGTGNRVGLRVQTSSGATDGLVITNEYKVISDQLLSTNSNKVETIVSTINIWDLVLTKEGQSVGIDEIIGTTDDITGSAQVGKDIRYTLTYVSNSSSGADNAYIIDPIPSNTCFKVGSLTNLYPPIAHTLTYSNDGGSTFSYSPIGGINGYDCNVTHIRINFTQSINAGWVGKFIFDVNVRESFTGNSIVNNATIYRSGVEISTINNTGSYTLPLYRSDLYINKSVNKTLTYPLDALQYTLDYGNLGPDTATSVVITDTLPVGFIYTSSTPTGILSGNQIIFTTGSLAIGQTGRITINGTISGGLMSGTVLNNIVNIRSLSNDSNTGNNYSSGTTTIRERQSDLVIIKNPSILTGLTGATLNYGITYRNYGPDTAPNVIIVDTLPTGFVYSSSSPMGIKVGNTLTWTSGQLATLGTLGTGFTGVINVFGSISGQAQSGDRLINVVNINSTSETNTGNNTSTGTTFVRGRSADLVITKTPSITSGYAGSGISYTITYRNYGLDNSPNTIISDSLPLGFVYSSSTPAGVLSGNVLTWSSGQIPSLGNLTTGFTGSITINGSVSGSFNGNQRLHNTVGISGGITDPNTGNNQATGSTFINPKADIRVVKKQSTGVFISGDKITYTLDYYNAGLDTGTNVIISDTRPNELLFISASTGYTFIPTNIYQFTIGTLPVGATGTIILTGQVVGSISGTKVGNSVLITGSEFDPVTGNNGTGVTGTIIDRYFDLELDKALNNTDPIYSGDKVGFTITVTNKGPYTGYNITVADMLPIGLSYLSHLATQGLFDQSIGLWFIGTLGVMQSVNLLLIGTSTAAGTFVNYAQIVGYSGGVDIDSTGGNNSGTGGNQHEDDDDAVKRNSLMKADVTINKTASMRSGHTGDMITFTLGYENSGSGKALNVSIVDTLPSGLIYASSYPAGVVSGGSIVRASGQISALNNLSPGDSGSITINAYISSGATSGQLITNTVTISTTTPETNTGNNTDNATVLVNQWITDLEITKTPSIETGYGGEYIKYTIWYHNNGPDRGLNTIITDVLPEGFIYDYSVPMGVLSGNILTRASGQIPLFHEKFFPGDEGYITIYGTIDENYTGNQRLHNPISITTTVPDSNTGNNQNTGSIWILPIVDLSIEKTQSSNITYLGDQISYKLIYKNLGKDTGTNVVITDQWPIYIQFISASMPHSFSGPNLYSFTIPTLGPGEGGEIIVSGLVISGTSGTNITNYAIISGNELDPNWSNNETKINAIVQDKVNIRVIKESNVTQSILGSTITWTISYYNDGPGKAENVTIQDILPSGLTYINGSIIGTAINTTLSGAITYLFTLGGLNPGQTGSFTITTKVSSGYGTTLINNAIITTTTPETTTGDNSDDAGVFINSTFAGLVDPYTCSSNINGRITNTGNGVEYVKITIISATGVTYKEFYPALDTSNNFMVSIDYINTIASNFILSGSYIIQYTLKELSGKIITGSYSAFITNQCQIGGGGGGGGGPKYYCGDGILDTSRGEQCEPSLFNIPGKSCNQNCQIVTPPPTPYCGDGILDTSRGEQCEIGSVMSHGWSCNNQCKAIKIISNTDPVTTGTIHTVAGTPDEIPTKLLILPKTGADW